MGTPTHSSVILLSMLSFQIKLTVVRHFLSSYQETVFDIVGISVVVEFGIPLMFVFSFMSVY